MKTNAFYYLKTLAAALFIVAPVPAQETAATTGEVAKSPDETKAEAAETKPETWVDTYDALLQKYVASSGVKYAKWHRDATDRAELKKVIDAISTVSLKGQTRDEKLAFLLNAYNAWILHRILQDYPTKGPGGGGLFGRNSFFKSKNIRIGGATMSFHQLENDVIRPKFREPRIHFALNCASRSCPPLHTRAFRGETLDAVLTGLAKAFINENPNGVIATKGGKKLRVSKIFDWYGEDFPGGVVAYLNQYRGKNRFPAKAKVSFQDYNWALNETK